METKNLDPQQCQVVLDVPGTCQLQGSILEPARTQFFIAVPDTALLLLLDMHFWNIILTFKLD